MKELSRLRSATRALTKKGGKMSVGDVTDKGIQLAGTVSVYSSGKWKDRFVVLNDTGKCVFVFPEADHESQAKVVWEMKDSIVLAGSNEMQIIIYDTFLKKELFINLNASEQKDHWFETLRLFSNPNLHSVEGMIRVATDSGTLDMCLPLRSTTPAVTEYLDSIGYEVEGCSLFHCHDGLADLLPNEASVKSFELLGGILYYGKTNQTNISLGITNELYEVTGVNINISVISDTIVHTGLDIDEKVVMKIFLPDNSSKSLEVDNRTTVGEIKDKIWKKVGPFAENWRIYEKKPYLCKLLEPDVEIGGILKEWPMIHNHHANHFLLKEPPFTVQGMENKALFAVRLHDGTKKTVLVEKDGTITDIIEKIEQKLRNTVDTANWKLHLSYGESEYILKDDSCPITYLVDNWQEHYSLNYKPLDRKYFGSNFDDIVYVHDPPGGIPKFLVDCIEYVERHCLDTKGLLRIAAHEGSLSQMKFKLDQGADIDIASQSDPHLVAGLLKNFLKVLKEPLLTFALYNQFIRMPDTQNPTQTARDIICQLPLYTQNFVRLLLRMCVKIAAFEEHNLMSTQNLAIVLAPSILYAENLDPIASLQHIGFSNRAVDFLIREYETIFGETVQIPTLGEIVPFPERIEIQNIEQNILRVFIDDNTIKTLPYPGNDLPISELAAMVRKKMGEEATTWILYEYVNGILNYILPEMTFGEVVKNWKDPFDFYTNKFVLMKREVKVFGIPYKDFTGRDLPESGVPRLLEQWIEIIEETGLETEGVFRLSPNAATIEILRDKLDKGVYVDVSNESVLTVSGLIKTYLKSLPHPLMSFELYDVWLTVLQPETTQEQVQITKEILYRLPWESFQFLKQIFRMLFNISEYQLLNRMTPENLAIVFSPLLIYGKNPDPITHMDQMATCTKVIEFLIENYKNTFSQMEYTMPADYEIQMSPINYDELKDMEKVTTTEYENDATESSDKTTKDKPPNDLKQKAKKKFSSITRSLSVSKRKSKVSKGKTPFVSKSKTSEESRSENKRILVTTADTSPKPMKLSKSGPNLMSKSINVTPRAQTSRGTPTTNPISISPSNNSYDPFHDMYNNDESDKAEPFEYGSPEKVNDSQNGVNTNTTEVHEAPMDILIDLPSIEKTEEPSHTTQSNVFLNMATPFVVVATASYESKRTTDLRMTAGEKYTIFRVSRDGTKMHAMGAQGRGWILSQYCNLRH